MKYELIHDTIARQVYEKASTEARTRRKIEKQIRERFEAFQERGAQLTQDDLDYFTPYLVQVNISEEEAAFIEESRDKLINQKRTRQIIIGVVIGVLLIFSVVTLVLYRDSLIARKDAEAKLWIVHANELYRTQQYQVALDTLKRASSQILDKNQILDEYLKGFQQAYKQDSFPAALGYLTAANGLDIQKEKIRPLALKSTAYLIDIFRFPLVAKYHAEAQTAQASQDTLAALLLDGAFTAARVHHFEAAKDYVKQMGLSLSPSQEAFLNQIPQLEVYATHRKNWEAFLNELYAQAKIHFREPRMVWVEGGTFWMGDSTFQAKLSSFHIQRYEITNLEYLAFLNEHLDQRDSIERHWVDISEGPGSGNIGNGYLYFEGSRYAVQSGNEAFPVNNLSWYGARAYCEWLGYKLPTEAQWEYAAGGGLKGRTPDGFRRHRYAGSNTPDSVGWYNDNAYSTHHPIGRKVPNELGIYDLSGNLWEWCTDRYDSYPESDSVQVHPTGPTSGSGRVLRGGSWSYSAAFMRVSYRNFRNPDSRGNGSGFRPSRTP